MDVHHGQRRWIWSDLLDLPPQGEDWYTHRIPLKFYLPSELPGSFLHFIQVFLPVRTERPSLATFSEADPSLPTPLVLTQLPILVLMTTQHTWFHVSATWMETSWEQGLSLDFFNTKIPGTPEQCLACRRSSINTSKEGKIRRAWEGEREGGEYQWISTQVND